MKQTSLGEESRRLVEALEGSVRSQPALVGAAALKVRESDGDLPIIHGLLLSSARD